MLIRYSVVTLATFWVTCGLLGCSFPASFAPTVAPSKKQLAQHPVPFVPILLTRKAIIPASQRMRVELGVIADATDKHEKLVGPLRDILRTELYRTRRFEIFSTDEITQRRAEQIHDMEEKRWQREERRASTDEQKSSVAEDSRALAEERRRLAEHLRTVDAVLHIVITSTGTNSMTVDFRLENPKSLTVMFAASADVNPGSDRQLRETIASMAESIAASVPPSTKELGKILIQDDKVITINLGEKDGLIPGMNVFVIAGNSRSQGDTVMRLGDTYVAQAYIVAVYGITSHAVVFDGEDYRVGDMVRVK